jgi:hypothetical protein
MQTRTLATELGDVADLRIAFGQLVLEFLQKQT